MTPEQWEELVGTIEERVQRARTGLNRGSCSCADSAVADAEHELDFLIQEIRSMATPEGCERPHPRFAGFDQLAAYRDAKQVAA